MFKKLKDSWIERHRKDWELELEERKKEFARITELTEFEHKKKTKELELKQIELNTMLEMTDKRIAELHKKDMDLRHQIDVIEAKAAPDRVWCEAFSLGFSKAWDMMKDAQMDGLLRVRKKIEDDAINKAIRGT